MLLNIYLGLMYRFLLNEFNILKRLPDLKFKYVEEDQPEDFFIPYVWTLATQQM